MLGHSFFDILFQIVGCSLPDTETTHHCHGGRALCSILCFTLGLGFEIWRWSAQEPVLLVLAQASRRGWENALSTHRVCTATFDVRAQTDRQGWRPTPLQSP